MRVAVAASRSPSRAGSALLTGAPTAAQRARRANANEDRERNFELNGAQYDFVYDDQHKFTAYIGGLGAGKSFAGAVKGLRTMTQCPGSLGLIGAPTYPMLRDATMRSIFQVFPPHLIRSFNKTEGLLTLINGSEALFRSMDDPDNRRGPNLAWFWLDEGPLCGHYAWKVMKGRLRQAGYDVQAWITGTPHGADEFYEDFENYDGTQRPRDESHWLYRASTRENAHNLPPTYIEDLGYTGQFALQEIEGLFVTFEGLVYEMRPEWHVGEWPHAEIRPRLAIGGVDWGFTNPAVALPIWVDGDDRAYVVDEYYQRQAGFTGKSATVGADGHSKAILDFSRQYGITTWYCGPDEPGHISDLNALFGREKLATRAVAANDEIVEGIATVRRAMALRTDGTSGYRQSARCANLRAELRTYSYATGTSRGARRDPQEKPVKKFDHAADALRYALHSALGGKTRHRGFSAQQSRDLLERRPVSQIGGITIKRKVF